MSLFRISLLLVCASVASAYAAPEQVSPDASEKRYQRTLKKLRVMLKQMERNPRFADRTMLDGEIRSALCRSCHGKDGNSPREGSPSVAGQSAKYLIDQWYRYADGRRKDYWMSSLAQNFKEKDLVLLSVFYSRQKIKPSGGGDPSLIERGRGIFTRHCAECHGANGRGDKGYAVLAGQRPEYLVKMLKEYQNPAGKRTSPEMYARAWLLKSDQDRLAVATYLAHMK